MPAATASIVKVDSLPLNTEQDVVAYVLPSPGADLTVSQIKNHVAMRAPKFMVPDEVHFVASFPTTPTGKIQKFKLREAAESTRSAKAARSEA